MNTMIRRFSIALASTALAGGALLATGGAASAADGAQPVHHAHTSVVTTATSGTHQHRHDSRGGEAGTTAVVYYVDAARWHDDQVEATAQHISAARWYQDQVTWALSHR